MFDICLPSDQITVHQRHRLDLHYLICQTIRTLKHCKLWLFHLMETNIWQGQPDMPTGNTADIFNGFLSWILTAHTAPQLGHTFRPSELTSLHTRRKGEATQISNVKMWIFPQQVIHFYTQLSGWLSGDSWIKQQNDLLVRLRNAGYKLFLDNVLWLPVATNYFFIFLSLCLSFRSFWEQIDTMFS